MTKAPRKTKPAATHALEAEGRNPAAPVPTEARKASKPEGGKVAATGRGQKVAAKGEGKTAAVETGDTAAAPKAAKRAAAEAAKGAATGRGEKPAAEKGDKAAAPKAAKGAAAEAGKGAATGDGETPAAKKRGGKADGQKPAAKKPAALGEGETPAAKKHGGKADGETPAAKKPATPGEGRKPATPSSPPTPAAPPFNILIVAQKGRLEYEALVFAASLRAMSPGFAGRLIVAEPQPEAGWAGHDTLIPAPTREALEGLGAEITPFVQRSFSHAYPQGNKIEALSLLPPGENFVFFDTDTLVTGELAALPFDFARPAASMRREPTWPEPPLYGPGYHEIWASLYDRFGLDITPTLDATRSRDDWQRYLYFNAGWFFGADGPAFGARFRDYAKSIRDDQPEELASQTLWPWLDQIALPLVIASFGGGRPGPELDGLDGDVTCHYRLFPLLYARESDRAVEVLEQVTAPNRIKKILRAYEPIRRLVYNGRGRKVVRPMFDRDHLPARERVIRNALKAKDLWLR